MTLGTVVYGTAPYGSGLAVEEPEPPPPPPPPPPPGILVPCDAEEVDWIQADGTVHPMDAAHGLCAGRPYGRFLPPTVRREQARPEGPGSVLLGLGHGTRIYRVPLAFTGSGPAALKALLRSWSQRFNVLDGEGWLRYTSPDDDGDVRVLRCAYHAGMELDESRGSQRLGVMLTDLEVRAADPYWTDLVATEVPIGSGDRPAFLPIPNPTTGSFVTISSGTAWSDTDVTNDGDLPAYPIWTVRGPADGIVRFTNRDSGEFFELDGVLVGPGEDLIVDTEAGTVAVEGVNAWPYVTDPSRMWLLPPGTTQVGVDVEGSGDDTTVALAFKRLWLSV